MKHFKLQMILVLLLVKQLCGILHESTPYSFRRASESWHPVVDTLKKSIMFFNKSFAKLLYDLH